MIEISPSLDKLQVLIIIRGAGSGTFHLMEKAKGNLIFVRPLGKHPEVFSVVDKANGNTPCISTLSMLALTLISSASRASFFTRLFLCS